MKELASWLGTIGSRTIHSAIPKDILVYMTQYWLPNHAGSSTTAGELVAAPSSLAGLKSRLAMEFELLGCIEDWDAVAQSGNPMHSIQIRTMLTSYINHAAELV